MPSDSILLQLRNAAKVERDELIRFKLRDAADKLSAAVKDLAASPNTGAMVTLNGCWISAVRVLNQATPSEPTGGGGAKLQVAA